MRQSGIKVIRGNTIVFRSDYGPEQLSVLEIIGFRIREADFHKEYTYSHMHMPIHLFQSIGILFGLRAPVNINIGKYLIIFDLKNGSISKSVENIELFPTKNAISNWMKENGK